MTDKRRNGSTRRHRQWAATVLRRARQAGVQTCAICGQHLDWDLAYPEPRSPSADHKVAWVKAPHLRYAPANGQVAHLDCNKRRGDRDLDTLVPPPSREW